MKIKLNLTFALFCVLALMSGCKKKDNSTSTTPTPTPVTPTNTAIPTVITSTITNITDSTATTGGTVTSEGNSVILQVGVCWDEQPNPTLLRSKTINGAGTGSYISKLTDLKPNTTYYVRAYATNVSGTAYGNEISFKTTTPVVVKTWEYWNNGLSNSTSGLVISFGGDLLTSCSGVLFKDAGASNNWSLLSYGIGYGKSIAKILVKNGDLFALVPYTGIYYSSDAGVNWTLKNTGITDLAITDMVVAGNNLVALNINTSTIFTSNDNGASWSAVPLPTDIASPESITSVGSTLFIYDYSSGHVFSSTDNGQNWTNNFGPPNSSTTSPQIKGSGTKLYACTSSGLYVSSDNSASWTRLTESMGNDPVSRVLIDNANIYINSAGNLYSSTNNGVTWVKLTGSIPSGEEMIKVGNSLFVAGTMVYKYSLD